MAVFVSMLRGVNVGGRHVIKMDALRAMYGSLGLLHVKTYVQSGNVVFQTENEEPIELASRIEQEIEATFGFRSAVILRTAEQLREVIARNPFATRPDVTPDRLVVTFLASDPGREARDKLDHLEVHPEEIRAERRELYVFYPNGMGRSKLPVAKVDKILGTPGTSRNWNSICKLFEMAESLEAI